MIDFVKIEMPNKKKDQLIQKLRANNWKVDYTLDGETGEILEYPVYPEFQNLKIEILSPKFIQLRGSLHKFFENGNNIKSFNYNDFLSVIISLNESIGLDPFISPIHHIEFGVNIKPGCDIDDLINRILNHNGKNFYPMDEQEGLSLGINCKRFQYIIKIYRKKDTNILRVEIKVNRIKFLENVGVRFLIDLLDPTIWKALANELTTMIQELIIIDNSIDINSLKPKEKILIENWGNPKYLIKKRKENSRKFQYERRRYRAIISRYSKKNEHQEIIKLINEEISQLLTIDESTYLAYSNFIAKTNIYHFYSLLRREKWDNFACSEKLPPPEPEKNIILSDSAKNWCLPDIITNNISAAKPDILNELILGAPTDNEIKLLTEKTSPVKSKLSILNFIIEVPGLTQIQFNFNLFCDTLKKEKQEIQKLNFFQRVWMNLFDLPSIHIVINGI